MAGRNWTELLVWTFRGERFSERGIELRDLEALVHLRALLVELAKSVWRRQNSTRKNLSPHAEDSLELRIFEFREGSCEVGVYYDAPPPPPQTSWEEPDDPIDLVRRLPEAARMASSAFRALASRMGLPSDFPREVLPDLERLTRDLRPDETVAVRLAPPAAPWTPPASPDALPDRRPSEEAQEVLLDAALRAEVERVSAEEVIVRRTITGEVTMAALRGRAVIKVDGREVPIEFDGERARDVTRALHEHETVRLRVRGNAEMDLKTGRMKRLIATNLALIELPDPNAPSEALFERLAVEDSERLLHYLAPDAVKPSLQTFAAEIAGRTLPAERVIPALLALLASESPLVREGAVYGLAHHDQPEVVERLEKIAAEDQSPGVRAAAADVLGVR